MTLPRTLLLGIVLTLTGCSTPPGKPKYEDRHLRPDQVLDFSTLYGQNCAACHGGGAKTPIAQAGKNGPAPPLNDKVFIDIVSDSVLRDVITRGRHGTLMPAFAISEGGLLTSEQVEVIVAGIRSTWGGKPNVNTPIPEYLEGKTKGDKERGKKLFAGACAGCHGTTGEGRPGVAGAINNFDFLSLISDQALRRLIITGRPDLKVKMPDYEETTNRDLKDFKPPLTGQDVSDLVALLASWRAQGPMASR